MSLSKYKRTTRAVALLCAVFLFLSTLPSSVFADEEQVAEALIEENVDGVVYPLAADTENGDLNDDSSKTTGETESKYQVSFAVGITMVSMTKPDLLLYPVADEKIHETAGAEAKTVILDKMDSRAGTYSNTQSIELLEGWYKYKLSYTKSSKTTDLGFGWVNITSSCSVRFFPASITVVIPEAHIQRNNTGSGELVIDFKDNQTNEPVSIPYYAMEAYDADVDNDTWQLINGNYEKTYTYLIAFNAEQKLSGVHHFSADNKDANGNVLPVEEWYETNPSQNRTMSLVSKNIYSARETVFSTRVVIFNVPEAVADRFALYKKQKHYTPFVKIEPSSVETSNGYKSFQYICPIWGDIFYIFSPNETDGTIKLGRLLHLQPDVSTEDPIIVYGYTNETSAYEGDYSYQTYTGSNFKLDNSFRLPRNSDIPYNVDNLYLTVPDNNYLEMPEGSTKRVEAFRVWQSVDNALNNNFIEPNFHYEVIGDSVRVEEGGTEGREYATFTALKPGISVVKVTYDAMCWESSSGKLFYYNAVQPVHTRVVIVNVNGKNTAEIKPNIYDPDNGIGTEYDTIYFDRNVTDHADFTFKPTAKNGAALSVRVREPLVMENAAGEVTADVKTADALWDEGWTNGTANEDDSFTVPLKDGRNIIEISAEDGSVQYYVINARAISVIVSVNGDPTATSAQVGDTISISLDYVELPLQKMAGIYNPNYPDNGYIQYQAEDGRIYRGLTSQYSIPNNNAISFTATEPGTLRLTNGRIHTDWLGANANTHRDIGEEGTGANLDAGSGKGHSYLWCTLPDIVINVEGVEDSGNVHEVQYTVPNDVTLRVFNYAGYTKAPASTTSGVICYQLTDNGSVDGRESTYTWYAERSGYVTKSGTVNVKDQTETVEIDLTDGWEAIDQQAGTVKVRVVGDSNMPTPLTSISFDPENITDLYEEGYAIYNNGGYTVLHALVDAGTVGTTRKFTCVDGKYEPICNVTTTGRWRCEITHSDGTWENVDLDTLATTLVQNGDTVDYFWNAYMWSGYIDHRWFEPETLTVQQGENCVLTVISRSTQDDNATASPLSIGRLYVDGQEVTCARGDNNSIIIPASAFSSMKTYTITQTSPNGHYAEATVRVVKKQQGTPVPSGATVTFRLIGSTLADEKGVDFTRDGKGVYNGAEYVTWIPTTSYSYSSNSVTVGTVFADALKKAGLSYTGLNKNYISAITAPSVVGGYELAEMTNGERSGWMYTVNGVHPNRGLNDWTVTDGDEIVFHYVNDYSYEVSDWMEDGTHHQLGDSSTFDKWLLVADKAPTKPSSGTPSTGTNTDKKDDEVVTPTEDKTVEVTTEATVSNGEAKAEVSSSQISAALTEAKKDEDTTAIVIAPEVKGDADKVTVEIPKTAVSNVANNSDLAVTVSSDVADITIQNEGLTELAKETGSTVTMSAEKTDDGAVKVEVAVGSKVIDEVAGGLNIAVPVEKDDSGNVMVIVDAEGNETVVKKSLVDDETAKAIVDGSCTVKIVDNSKDFTDVSDGAWYAGDVDFASSHELFQGVSKTQFAPENQMTRAMLATVLFRLEDAAATGSNSFADVPAGAYYTDAVTWANGAGIVQGYGNSFGSEDNITRQDLATMLYRYAKTIGMDTAVRGDMSSFNDTGKVSDYADDAMRWAVGMGIIGGKGNGVLDPKGNATRAEVAAMLQRLVKIMVK